MNNYIGVMLALALYVLLSASKRFRPPDAAAPFMPIFRRASEQHGVPLPLLVRVGEQESYFDPQAYNDGSGASGIMQLVPRWYPGVDPFNPSQAIPAAAESLRDYYDEFGAWSLALAAYNWGPGNLKNALDNDRPITAWPTETRNYIVDIVGDTGIA